MTHTGNMVLPEPVPAFTRESRLAMTGRRLSSCIWHGTLAPAVTVHNNKIALNTRAILLPFRGRDMRKLCNGSRLLQDVLTDQHLGCHRLLAFNYRAHW